MTAEYIGLVVGADTRTVYAVVNPETDDFLDDPCHLELQNERQEPVQMVKVSRERYGYPGEMTPDDVYTLMVRWYVEESEVYHGPDVITGAV